MLKPDPQLTQKESLMTIFKIGRQELHAMLKAESEDGKVFVDLYHFLNQFQSIRTTVTTDQGQESSLAMTM